MSDVYVVCATGAWRNKIRGIFTEKTDAIRFAQADRERSDGYHKWEVRRIHLNTAATIPDDHDYMWDNDIWDDTIGTVIYKSAPESLAS